MDLNQIKTYKSIILFNEILINNRVFKTIFNQDDQILEPLFVELLAKGYVFVDKDQYHISSAGEKVFELFMNRYREYLKVYDIYCAVDINNGIFAFEKFFDYDEAQFDVYKNVESFYDIRIPVSIFKKIDPTEIVFMSFINENRFDTSSNGWQFDLIADNMWNQIDEIVNTSITIEDLGGDEAMQNIINAGTKIMFDLINKEIELKKQALEQAKALQIQGEDQEEYVVETTTIIEECESDMDYYDPYWDPYYCSPLWLVPLFLW